MMKVKDLMNIVLKVFGLLVFKEIVFQLPYLINPLIYYVYGESNDLGFGVLAFSLFMLLFYFALAYILIFKTTNCLKLFKFEQHFFDTDLSINISRKNIIEIGLFILSGYILIEEIPILCKHCYDYYELRQIRIGEVKLPTPYIILSISKILIASLIIGEREKLVRYILNEKKPPEETAE